MKTLQIIMILCLMAMAGCVTNGGDIGALYGEWALRTYTIDGNKAEIDCSNYYWQFQGSIISILTVKDSNESGTSFGTWKQEGDNLTLNFAHTNQNQPESVGVFDPPAELGIPGRAITVMHIDKLQGRQLILSYTDDEGQVKKYTFEKLL